MGDQHGGGARMCRKGCDGVKGKRIRVWDSEKNSEKGGGCFK